MHRIAASVLGLGLVAAVACGGKGGERAAVAVTGAEVGTVLEVEGEVTASRAGQARPLVVGQRVHDDDVVATGDGILCSTTPGTGFARFSRTHASQVASSYSPPSRTSCMPALSKMRRIGWLCTAQLPSRLAPPVRARHSVSATIRRHPKPWWRHATSTLNDASARRCPPPCRPACTMPTTWPSLLTRPSTRSRSKSMDCT